MKYFPDEASAALPARIAVLVIPLLYLAIASTCSAYLAPWGQQVDPEAAYAMNGLVAAAGYGSMKFDHPGTTTTLLAEIVIRSWALVARPDDIVVFGFRHYDAIIYAARTGEIAILTGVLAVGGFIVRNATGSAVAAMLFQATAFMHRELFHYGMILAPDSLMATSAMLAMALAIKAALDRDPPSVHLGALSGLVFAFGFSSKYLFLPMAALGVTLLRNRRAFAAAYVTGLIAFVAFNLAFNPAAITRGFGWLYSIASHKGIYGEGAPGFIDIDVFWPNMVNILVSAPLISAIYGVAALSSFAWMARTRNYSDPVNGALLASCVVFVAQLVATSKHFALHYMMTSWMLAGGVLVLTAIQVRRLVPALPAGAVAAVAAAGCAFAAAGTLAEVRHETIEWIALDEAGAKLSRAVVTAGPACANVSGMYVRAPENETNHGYDMTMRAWGDQAMKDRFSRAPAQAFGAPLLDHNVYMDRLARDFRPVAYPDIAAEYPCIVVRSFIALNSANSAGLLDLHPDHCLIDGIHVYGVGIACMTVQRAFSARG